MSPFASILDTGLQNLVLDVEANRIRDSFREQVDCNKKQIAESEGRTRKKKWKCRLGRGSGSSVEAEDAGFYIRTKGRVS